MFNLLKKRGTQPPTPALREALVRDGLPAGVDPTTLGVLEERGRYAGRSVTYVRVFDAITATAAGLQPRAFGDLDQHPDLIMAIGHVEQNGAIVLTRQPVQSENPLRPRDKADRAAHEDDERHVFPNASA